jgi:hypothetical protein
MPTFDAPSPSPVRWPYIGRYGKPGISRRELPYTFLILAIIFGFGALVLPLLGWLRMAKESDLKFVAGSVLQAPTLLRPSWPIIRIPIETDGGPAYIYEEDMSHSQEIMNLKPGDHVTARVKFLTVGTLSRRSGEYHIFELKRDGVTIESYQDSDLSQTRELQQYRTNALWVGLLSSICLAVALALRMHFGEWVDSTPLVPADAIGSVQGAIRLPHYRPLSSADYPRTYYMSQGQEALTLLGGLILIGLGIFRLWSATADVSSMLPGIFFLIFGIIAILRDLRFRVVLSADSIEVHNLVSTRVLRRDEILGRRLVQTRGAQIIRLMPQGGQQPVGVPLILKTDSAFSEWMDTIPDLDTQDPL